MYIKNKFGYCYYEFVDDYVHIYGLYILPKYRQQGKATELLKQVIKEIRKQG